MEEAEKLINEMAAASVVPYVVTYTVLIDGYGSLGLITRAIDMLKSMRDSECKPSHCTFSILMKHLLNKKQAQKNGNSMHLNVVPIDIVNVWKLVDSGTHSNHG
ncbi:hypothetical protein Droror1_Dr00024260 [Drosera rotundifolia]